MTDSVGQRIARKIEEAARPKVTGDFQKDCEAWPEQGISLEELAAIIDAELARDMEGDNPMENTGQELWLKYAKEGWSGDAVAIGEEDFHLLLAELARERDAVTDALLFVFGIANRREYDLGTYKAFFSEMDQIEEYHCFGCDAKGYAKWPTWKLAFTHSDDCKYIKAEECAARLRKLRGE